MSIEVALIVGFILALVSTIALFLIILPKKKDGKLHGFLQFFHDFFNTKKLYLELILKVIYVFSTCLCVFYGLMLLVARYEIYSYDLFSSGGPYYESTAVPGLIILLLGPLLLRLAYEILMLLILAVKNLMEINHNTSRISKSLHPEGEPTAAPCLLYCTQCGTQYDTNAGKCPHCGLE